MFCMNHPDREQWVPFLYGELKSDARRQLKAHLHECDECRTQLESWQHSLQRLDAWKLPRAKQKTAEVLGFFFRWAAAAALVLGLGFGIGYFTATGSKVGKLRAQLEPQIRESLRQEIHQMVQEESKRSALATLVAAEDHAEKLLAAYNAVQENRRAADLENLYVAIKKQLDTVAINTEKGLLQFAGYTRPESPSHSPKQ